VEQAKGAKSALAGFAKHVGGPAFYFDKKRVSIFENIPSWRTIR
jgi:hypothetical protein